MARMCCVSCNGVSLTTSGPEHTIRAKQNGVQEGA